MFGKRKIILLLLLLPLLAGCFNRGQNVSEIPEGSYFYSNEGMGFSLVLPEEFIYYQTQRKDLGAYSDLEIFVPTSDREYPQEVQSYAKPITVRVFNSENYESESEEGSAGELMGSKGGKTYVLIFWEQIPVDWLDKWNDEMRDEIKERFNF